MRILFVGLSNNIHTARWINQLAGRGWDIHLFSVDDQGGHPDLRECTVHQFIPVKPSEPSGKTRLEHFRQPYLLARVGVRALLIRTRRWSAAARLTALIKKVKPDIVHSLGIQHAAYLTLAAKKLTREKFPLWIVTNWGSDIHFSMFFEREASCIRAVLESCDSYSCECQRDVSLAHDHGFRGHVWPVMPNTGGVDIAELQALRDPMRSRKLILIKGYQNWYGRALVALKALEMCASELRGYRIALYSAMGFDTEAAATLIKKRTDLRIEILPWQSHQTMLRLHAVARASISLSITDGICTSMLEALAAGSFPIQSNTACADEWVVDGDTAFLVDPDDPHAVAAALKRVLGDDKLVEQAARKNWETTVNRLNREKIQSVVVGVYQQLNARGSFPVDLVLQ